MFPCQSQNFVAQSVAWLYAPVKLGYKMTKYLTRVTFTRERHEGYWERRGYPWLGGI